MANNAAAFFAGLGEGFLDGKDKQKKDARQKKLDDQADAEFQARQEDRQADKSKRRAVAAAGATVDVEQGAGGMTKPATMDNRDVGQPDTAAMPNAGLLPGAVVQGKNYADPAQAQAAAAAANQPDARATRIAAAMYGAGDAAGGIQMEAAARQGKAADLQIKQAEEAAARDKMFRETASLVARGGWAAIPKVYDQYNDGNSAQVVEDGKGGATVVAMDKDGKEVGRKQFASLDQFMLGVLPQLDPKLWVTENARAGERAADAAHKTAVLDETKRSNQANEAIKGDVAAAKIDAATARAEASRAKAAAAGTPVGVTAKELEDASKTISTRMTEIYQPKEGMTPEERDGLGKQRDKAASEAQGIYRLNNTGGNVIDTGTAIYAARLAADPKSLMQRAADDGKMYPGVMVNGQFVVTGPPLMKKDPPKSAAAPAAPAPAKPLPAAARPLPTSVDAVPGAKDTSQRVARGTDLMVR